MTISPSLIRFVTLSKITVTNCTNLTCYDCLSERLYHLASSVRMSRKPKIVCLFATCVFMSSIWCAMFKWLGITYVLPGFFFFVLLQLCGPWLGKTYVSRILLIWHTVLCLVWKDRKDLIFKVKVLKLVEVVDLIKRLSWDWLLDYKSMSSCFFFFLFLWMAYVTTKL